MKTESFIKLGAGLALLQSIMAFGQPPSAPLIDPATGIPRAAAGGSATPPSIDYTTGLPRTMTSSASIDAQRAPYAAIQDASQTAGDVTQLINNNQYEEALRQCLAYHEKYKPGGNLNILLPQWIELGRRFPKAKAALVEIRDRDVSEFAAGRGFFDLFTEVSAINNAFGQNDSTYDLFKSFRDTDPELARQCYGSVEGLMVARGDYQWCYDHMGDPLDRYNSLQESFRRQVEMQQRLEAMDKANRKRMEQVNEAHGWTNMPNYIPPDPSPRMIRNTQNGFVDQTRHLIEILVATGHEDQAGKIRDQSLLALDDDRLKSSVEDAQAKLKK